MYTAVVVHWLGEERCFFYFTGYTRHVCGIIGIKLGIELGTCVHVQKNNRNLSPRAPGTCVPGTIKIVPGTSKYMFILVCSTWYHTISYLNLFMSTSRMGKNEEHTAVHMYRLLCNAVSSGQCRMDRILEGFLCDDQKAHIQLLCGDLQVYPVRKLRKSKARSTNVSSASKHIHGILAV